MFYYILLAHLVADYPLQPTWIVTNKNRVGVLILHSTIHFLTSMIIVWFFITSVTLFIWPYVLCLAVTHLLIDLVKIKYSQIRPSWVRIPYLVDQILHVFSMIIISIIIQRQLGIIAFPVNPGPVVLVIAYLFVTYVWYINEIVLTNENHEFRQVVTTNFWSRMLFRALFLTGYLGIWIWKGGLLLAPISALPIPYQLEKAGKKALLIDAGVTFGVFLLIRMLLGSP